MRLASLEHSALAATLFLLSAVTGHAGTVTSGNELVRMCKASERVLFTLDRGENKVSLNDSNDSYHCIGIIQGVSETLDAWRAVDAKLGNVKAKHACMPAGVTVEEETRIFLRYAERHPEELHEAGSSLLIYALTDAFPCK